MKNRNFKIAFPFLLTVTIFCAMSVLYGMYHQPEEQASTPVEDSCVVRADEIIYYLDCGYSWEKANRIVDSLNSKKQKYETEN